MRTVPAGRIAGMVKVFRDRIATTLLLVCPFAVTSLHAANAKLRIGIVQMALAPTLAENRDRIVAGVGDVAARGGRLAVFPENALAGQGNDMPRDVAGAIDAIRRAADARNIYVLFGGATFSSATKKDMQWARAFGPDGAEVFHYEKLYNNPRAPMPGVFDVDGIPCSAMICADRWLRGVDDIPIQLGAKVSIELACNFASEWVEPLGWYWYVPRALRNNVWIVFANTGNPAAPTADIPRHGHSAVISPAGRLLAGSGESAGIVMADLDPLMATRAEAIARAAHPALREFWAAGMKLQRGEPVPAPPLAAVVSPAREITLAVAQIAGDRAKLTAAVREARVRGADLVAFPAGAIGESEIAALQQAAREHQIVVVAGVERHDGAARYNSAVVLGPDGSILTRYDQLSASPPFQPGAQPGTMWFQVKGVPAVVTIGRDAVWNELAELAAVAGAQIHVHLDRDADASPAATLRRRQIWAGFASFHTFTAVANTTDSTIWDDISGALESRSVVRNTAKPDTGATEIYSPFSANLVVSASADRPLIVATRKVAPSNPQFTRRSVAFNPQMEPWFRIGAAILRPR